MDRKVLLVFSKEIISDDEIKRIEENYYLLITNKIEEFNDYVKTIKIDMAIIDQEYDNIIDNLKDKYPKCQTVINKNELNNIIKDI